MQAENRLRPPGLWNPSTRPPRYTERAARAVPSRFGQRAARGLTAHVRCSAVRQAVSCSMRAGSSLRRCGGERLAPRYFKHRSQSHRGKGLTSQMLLGEPKQREGRPRHAHTMYICIHPTYEITNETASTMCYLLFFFGPFPPALPALPLPNPRPFGTACRCFPVVKDVVNIALFLKTSRM